MKLTDESKKELRLCGIPAYMHEGITAFYEDGRPPGDFLSAVINNDLKGAVTLADDRNVHLLKNYVLWFYNWAPGGTWGFDGAVKKHCGSFKRND